MIKFQYLIIICLFSMNELSSIDYVRNIARRAAQDGGQPPMPPTPTAQSSQSPTDSKTDPKQPDKSHQTQHIKRNSHPTLLRRNPHMTEVTGVYVCFNDYIDIVREFWLAGNSEIHSNQEFLAITVSTRRCCECEQVDVYAYLSPRKGCLLEAQNITTDRHFRK
jgi:hypothetical protein